MLWARRVAVALLVIPSLFAFLFFVYAVVGALRHPDEEWMVPWMAYSGVGLAMLLAVGAFAVRFPRSGGATLLTTGLMMLMTPMGVAMFPVVALPPLAGLILLIASFARRHQDVAPASGPS